MRFVPIAILGGVFFTLALLPASASTIYNVSTGQNSSGVVQNTGDSVDANWVYNDAFVNGNVPNGYPTTGHAKVVGTTSADNGFSAWVPNSSSSAWIAPDPDTTNNGDAPYNFTDTFNLTGYALSSVALSGAWAIDDGGTLSLNGHVISTVASPGYSTLTDFSAPNSDFVPGVNTLVITMTQADRYVDAADLTGSVTGTAAASTPEPASLWLFAIVGLAGMLSLAFRQGIHKLRA